jgi:RNA polymerase primary sigma factor
MFGLMTTSRSSPAVRSRADIERVILFPRMDTTGPEDLEGPAAGSPGARPTAGDPATGLRIFEPKARRPRKADLGRARRLLAADLTYIAHPGFDDPGARDAILAPATGFEGPGRHTTPARRDPAVDPSPEDRLPTREREAHAFRKLNYLKFLACRIRDGIDPDSPVPGDLNEIERLQIEAVRLKNRIVETHLRLAVSVAKRHAWDGYDLPERVSDATLALMQAVDRFDFARGNRFSTYATWAIINELTRAGRKQMRRRSRPLAPYEECLAIKESESERYEREEAQDVCRAVVERLLGRLDRRERRILEYRHGIGGGLEQSLKQIGRDLGISKERVRQIEQRAHSKLRSLAHLEAIGLSSLQKSEGNETS